MTEIHVENIELLDFDDNWLEVFAAYDSGDTDALHAAVAMMSAALVQEGRQLVLVLGEARAAMLDAQAHWLDIAAQCDEEPGRSLALMVAQAFHDRADFLRVHAKPTLEEPPSGRVAEILEHLEASDQVLPPAIDLDCTPEWTS
jgi:hypothetical protein